MTAKFSCEARHVDEVLRTLDEAAAEVGAVRGRGDNAKSVVRLLGQPSALAAIDNERCTEYVAESTKAIPIRGGHVLGIDFEGSESSTSQFEEVAADVTTLHDNLAHVEDVATEITLVRACADVCKVSYILRARGNEVAVPALEKYDKLLQSTLERALGGPIGSASII